MKRCIIFVMIAAGVLLTPQRATAVTRAGLLKLSLDSSFIGFGTGEIDPEGGDDNDFGAPTFGVGLSSPGIGLGYTVIDKLVIGGRVTLGVQGHDDLFGDYESFFWSVLPYFEYIFLSGVARPFVTGTLGFEGVKVDAFDDDGRWWWGFTFGGGGGAHFFVIEQVSLDAMLLLTFTVGGGEDERPDDDLDFKLWHFKLSGLFGLSAWF
ncbi:MAG: hypothetical protein GY854_09535 [Deltaproteobacteria bacterium]|nr:hypothetical protein [Deltaproteobacteria bacterium]